MKDSLVIEKRGKPLTTSRIVAKWETGVSLPRANLLPALAKMFNCTIDDLFGAPVSNKEFK